MRGVDAAGGLVLAAFGCKREVPPLRASVPSTAAAAVAVQPPMPVVDAGPPEPTGIHLVDRSCGWTVFAGRDERDASVVDLVQDATDEDVTCEVPDAGVVWTLPAGESAPFRRAHFLRELIRMDLTTQHDVYTSQFTARLAEQAARGDATGCATEGMLFRAPERMVGREVQVRGTAQNVREADGNTLLTVALDYLGRETVDVTYPGVANQLVVDGAEVLVYGIATGSHQVEIHRQIVVVPEVAAFRCIAQRPEGPEGQLNRMMRSLRHRR